MKKTLSVLILALAVSAPSFASDLVGHAAKDSGKGVTKVATYSAKSAAAALKKTARFLF